MLTKPVVLIICIFIGLGVWYTLTHTKTYPAGSVAPSRQLQQPAERGAATSSVPMFESYYEIQNTELYSAVNIALIPTKLGEKSTNGIEIMLQDQKLPIPEPYQVIINANITGELQKEWTCQTIAKIAVRCGGSIPLALGESTTLALYFGKPPVLPEHIRLRLLHDATATVTIEIPRRE